MSDEDRTTTPGSGSPPPPPEPRLGERLGEHAERARELGQALGRRLAQPPRGGAVLRWAGTWIAGLGLVASLAACWWGGAPALWWAVLLWLLWVLTREQPLHALWGVAVIAFLAAIPVVLLGGLDAQAVWFNALPPAAGAGIEGSIVLLVVYGALNRGALNRAIWWLERLGVLALGVWGWFVAFLVLAGAGLTALHPVVAAVDPPARVLLDAMVGGAAFAVSAAAALAALWIVQRAHRLRHGGVA